MCQTNLAGQYIGIRRLAPAGVPAAPMVETIFAIQVQNIMSTKGGNSYCNVAGSNANRELTTIPKLSPEVQLNENERAYL